MTQVYMTSGRMKLAEHARQAHVVTIPQGVSLETALEPAFWSHVAQQVRPRDRIELWAEDRAWFADAVVVSASRLAVTLMVLAKVSLDAAPPALPASVANSNFHIDYGGGVDLWRVIRNADSMVMASGMSQAEAERWMADHVAAVAPLPPPATEPAKLPSTASSTVAETAETRAAVVIPEDWKAQSWQERRSLASKLTDAPIHNGEEANAAIEAELAKRAA